MKLSKDTGKWADADPAISQGDLMFNYKVDLSCNERWQEEKQCSVLIHRV